MIFDPWFISILELAGLITKVALAENTSKEKSFMHFQFKREIAVKHRCMHLHTHA